jgi:transposase
VAFAALKKDRTTAQLAEPFDVHATQITSCNGQLFEGAADAFERGGNAKPRAPGLDITPPHTAIGELVQKKDFFRRARLGGISERKPQACIDEAGIASRHQPGQHLLRPSAGVSAADLAPGGSTIWSAQTHGCCSLLAAPGPARSPRHVIARRLSSCAQRKIMRKPSQRARKSHLEEQNDDARTGGQWVRIRGGTARPGTHHRQGGV